jgi:hypothetical protein
MAGGIYLVNGDDLVEMVETPFAKEELFQKLLADFPRVLGGDQLDGAAPKQWLLVCREAGIPDAEGGANRWAIDHLFVDEDSIPTFVEVKRSSDTRARREVVGQMLDYVSHAINAWPENRMRGLFEARCGLDESNTVFADALGGEIDQDHFWASVETNLRDGRVRLVFVADKFPPELLRIVEFLSGQMKPAEVLGIEVRQYVGRGLQTLVPRVIGRRSTDVPATRGARWDRERFLKALRDSAPSLVELAERLLDFAADVSGRPVEWGTGKDSGSFTAKLRVGREIFSLFSVYTTGGFTVNIGWNAIRLERLNLIDFDVQYRERFSSLIGRSISQEAWRGGYGSIDLNLLSKETNEQRFESLVRDLAVDLKAVVPTSDSA